MECPCGCESGLDDKYEAHSYSTISLIKGCDKEVQTNNSIPILLNKTQMIDIGVQIWTNAFLFHYCQIIIYSTISETKYKCDLRNFLTSQFLIY